MGEQLIILKRVNNRVHRTISYSSYLYTTPHDTRHDTTDTTSYPPPPGSDCHPSTRACATSHSPPHHRTTSPVH